MTRLKNFLWTFVLFFTINSCLCERGLKKTDKFEKSNHSRANEEINSAVVYPSYDEGDIREKVSNGIASGVMSLSQKLATRVLQSSSNDYEVFSPISISGALQLVLLGSKGTAYDELRNVMGYSDLKDFEPKYLHTEFSEIIEDLLSNRPNIKRKYVNWRKNATEEYIKKSMKHQNNKHDQHKIEVANGVFVQEGYNIRQLYKNVARTFYKSEVKNVDFKGRPAVASKTINDWVKDKTHGKISDIVPPVMSPNTRIVLANALYFKAEWQQTFIEGATGPKPFYPNGKAGQPITVDMMAQGGLFPFYRDTELNVDILGFPYKLNQTTMYVILPNNSNMEILKEVQSRLTAERIEQMIDNMVIKTAVILFPKMHLKAGYHLKSDLQDLGVQALFEEGQCDLSPMAEVVTERKNNSDMKMGDKLTHHRESMSARGRQKRDITYKVSSENQNVTYPLTMKDFLNRKRIVKNSHNKKTKKYKRVRRNQPGNNPQQRNESYISNLENLRIENLINPHLYADDVIHKVDLEINEKGTEGGAATAITLNRSGSNVIFRADTPFMFIIRHDFTKIPLFYGVVFKPPTASEKNSSTNESDDISGPKS